MNRKIKIVAGFLTVIFCILAGCERKEEEFLFLTQEEHSEEMVSLEDGDSFSEQGGREESQENMEGSASLKESGSTPFQDGDFRSVEDISEERKVCVVHICGAVNDPGVYTMEDGSRVYQVIEKAGGFREDAREDYLNQADLLSDGMKIYVPTREETEEGDFQWEASSPGVSGGAGAAKDEGSGLVNINTAGEEQLCTLPGVGSSKAKSIIAWREQNGAYRTIEDIMNVEGIKDGVFQKIKDSITV